MSKVLQAVKPLGVIGYYAATTGDSPQAWRIHIWEARHTSDLRNPERSRALCNVGTSFRVPTRLQRRALDVMERLAETDRACPRCMEKAPITDAHEITRGTQRP